MTEKEDATKKEDAKYEPTLQASISETLMWSSNPLLSIAGNTSVWGSTTSPELVFRKATPLSQMNIGVRIDENIFNKSSFSSTDVHEAAMLSKRNQRWMATLQQSIDYDTTNTSEPTNYGLPAVVARHTGFSLSPSIAFKPSDTDTYTIGGTATVSMYNKSVFTDYRTLSADMSYSHRFDPLNTGVISMEVQQYRTTQSGAVSIDSWSPIVGWERTFSSRLSGNVSVGAQTSRQYNYGVAVTPWEWQYVFTGSLSYKGDQDKLDVTVSRAQVPYGNGTEALQTSFSLKGSHDVTPSFTLNFGADYRIAEYQTSSAGNLKSLAGARLGVAYHLTETLDLTADYSYRYETLTNEAKKPQDNAFMVGLVYKPKTWNLTP